MNDSHGTPDKEDTKPAAEPEDQESPLLPERNRRRLQTEIVLSSTEAEYIALSQCCRALLPIRRTLKDILSCGLFPNSLKLNTISNNNIMTKKFEHHYHSNNPLENRPRTKHISIKWHHFLDEIRKGNTKVTKIHTSLNISEILTKPLVT
jgi:hypothetical protein